MALRCLGLRERGIELSKVWVTGVQKSDTPVNSASLAESWS